MRWYQHHSHGGKCAPSENQRLPSIAMTATRAPRAGPEPATDAWTRGEAARGDDPQDGEADQEQDAGGRGRAQHVGDLVGRHALPVARRSVAVPLLIGDTGHSIGLFGLGHQGRKPLVGRAEGRRLAPCTPMT